MEYSDAESREFTVWKTNHEQALNAHNNYQEEKRQMFGSAMDMALEAIRTAAVINGGAVIAVFAFLGTLLAAESGAARTMRIAIVEPAFLFAAGAVLSGVASGLSYFAQLAFTRSYEEYDLNYERPYITETKLSKRFGIVGEGFRVLAVLSVLTSYGALIAGLVKGYGAFASHM